MNRTLSRAVAAALLGLGNSLTAQAGQIDPTLQAQLKGLPPTQPVAVIITLASRPDLNAVKDKDKLLRRAKLVRALRDTAQLKQKPVLQFLSKKASDIKELWIVNGVSARVPAKFINQLASLPGVAQVRQDATLGIPGPNGDSNLPPTWNLTAVHAPDLWNLGHIGQGMVVANMDTGVDLAHPDLLTRYRGGSNSWYDPHGQHATPTDYALGSSGHGTQTMGLMVGGDAGGSFIGVAPGAQWIAVKVFDDNGSALESHFHQGFQWLLDPDNNPLTDDAPHVLNASFQTAAAGLCDNRFNADIEALKTAGIAVAIAAGNSGTAGSSSPANNPVGFAVGAVNSLNNIASFSARGPSTCDGTVFPELVAPGVSVRTSDLSLAGMATYVSVSGTSFATPHVAGGLALLMEAFPNATVTELEGALTSTATDRGLAGPDNSYGHGLMNLQAAYNALAATNLNPVSVNDSFAVDEDGNLSVPAAGVLGNDSDPQNDPLGAVLVDNVGHGTLTLNNDGSFAYTPTANFNGVDSFTYQASDGTHLSATATVTINVNPVNDPPVAQPDSATLDAGSSLAIAVLSNDSDVDQNTLTPVIDIIPSHGNTVANPDGTISYTHDGSPTTTDSFSYHVNDGQANSTVVTVNLTINPVNPVGSADSYSVDEDTVLTAPAPGVLANDTPATGLTAQTVTAPLHAASFALNADGSFNYTPAANYNGSDSFVYRAIQGTTQSADVTVTLTVTPINDAPVAANDAAGGNEDSALSGSVLANDTDQENHPLTAQLVNGPAHGVLSLNADGSYSYTPNANFNGADSFTYRANDGQAQNNLSNVATVSLTVSPVNDAPALAAIPSPQAATVGSPFSYSASASDADLPGDTLSYSLTAAPADMTINPATGQILWTPAVAASGIPVVVRVSDAGGAFAEQGFTLNVQSLATNTAPIAVNDTTFLYRQNVLRTVNYAGTLGLGVLANDADAENQPLLAQLVTNVPSGTLNLNANGSFTYARNATGNVTFTYRANDGQSINNLSNTATATLVTDTAPAANNDTCVYDVSAQTVTQAQRCTVNASKVVTVNVALNDTDANATTNIPTDGVGKTVVPGSAVITAVGSGVNVVASACQAAMGTAPGARGSIVNNCDGTMTITVAPGNASNSIAYTYRIKDDLGAQSSTRQNALTVQP